MKTVTYRIPNISCHHCVHTIKSELSEVPGVKSVEGDVQTKTAKIVFDAPADESGIKKVLAEINYPAAD